MLSRALRPSAALFALLAGAAAANAQGIVLQGVGPVNRSMAGAAVAAPIDASGALYWNPAAIAGLQGSELEVGLELIFPRARVSSSVPANAFGPNAPPVSLSGLDKSDSGAFAVPTTGLVYQPEGSPLAFGLGLFVVGGFGANYPASDVNPVLTPQPPRGLGLGGVFSDFQVIQFVPTVAAWLTDRIAVGFAPTLNLGNLSADPGFLIRPDDANGDGSPTYAPQTHRRSVWGGGFQVGVYYTGPAGWNLGASLKSKQWFEEAQYNAQDEAGRPRRTRLRFEYPMIVSAGVGYTGFDRWTLAADFRYLDYKNTAGFARSGFGADGAVLGLGWDNVFGLALGAQYQATDALSVRAGYAYSTDPIDDQMAIFNVASPLVTNHSVYVGATYKVTAVFSTSVAYGHLFSGSVTGPFQTPLGAVPGTSVTNRLSSEFFIFGATAKF